MLTSQDRQIGESIYRVHTLGATPSLDLLLELGRMVGPSLGILVDGLESGKLSEMLSAKLSGDAFGRALEGLASRMDTPKVQGMIAKLRAKTEVDVSGGGAFQQLAPVYEVHFAGKMSDLFAWFKFALEVQYGDFFALLGSLAPPARAAESKPSPAES